MDLLTNGTTGNTPHENGVKRKEIDWVDDVEAVLSPISHDFAVYQVKVFPGTANQTYVYNQTFTIPSEGVYSTYFLFGKHREEAYSDDSDFLDDFVDDLFGDDDTSRIPDISNHNLR